ncbi:MAG: 30S ribosomal protein S12 methylthiotransferase RimO [Clostridiales bacterium]|nr:30S ribosomal protein S12 methylthiotransferase RimO [Clostridiales bacterium]
MNVKVGFISLGCPKNQVDAELMLHKLEEAGCEIVDLAYDADIVVVNTCGFIEDAKKEAIETILEMAELKKEGSIQKILVTGCLAQRYKYEIIKEIPEVDGIIGIGANDDIVPVVESLMNGEQVQLYPDNTGLPLNGERLLTTPNYWAYLKIADGCSNCCSYCAIPSIRGPFRSRAMEDIVAEAEKLAEGGAKELVVIAQDTTRYGLDLYGELMLPELLRRLNGIDGLQWIRLLYCYPDRMTDELIDTIASCDKVLHYIDLPVQHADGAILKAMNRTGNKDSLLSLIEKIRAKIPDVVLRTSLIVGFPGETEEAFNTLSEFTEQAQFDRLGCFAYSAEEGTKAAEMDNQVDDEVKQHRVDVIMEQQFDILQYKQKQFIGKTLQCIVEGYDAYTDSYFGRTWMDAPEVDSEVYFTGKGNYNDGDIVDVEIFDINEYDLMGEIVG